MSIRIGYGFDIHNLKPSVNTPKPLVIGGILVDPHVEVEAHSDGDVILHALIDSILGALGKEDIGDLFPPTNNKFRDIDSAILLQQIFEYTKYPLEWKLVNIDITVILEKPKLGCMKPKIKENLQKLLGTAIPIAIKAKTFEQAKNLSDQVWCHCACLIDVQKNGS